VPIPGTKNTPAAAIFRQLPGYFNYPDIRVRQKRIP